MAVDTVQSTSFDPIDIHHRLTQIKLQLQRQSAFTGSSASAFSPTSCMSSWILDYGAYHITSDSTILSTITPLPPHFLPLHTAVGSQLAITQIGSITSPSLTLPLVLHVPHLCMNLYPSAAYVKLVSLLLLIPSLVL